MAAARATLVALAVAFAGSPAVADELDDLFSDANSQTIEEAKPIDNPEKTVLSGEKFSWAGDLTATAGAGLSYEDTLPKVRDWSDPDDRLLLDFNARLWFDARPDDDFRVFGKFTLDYPFAADALPATSTGESDAEAVSVANLSVFELFGDIDWKDRAYIRFGKQNLGWGVSRFYQVADPLSVGVKDPNDPAADLEGPVALKVTVPFALNSLVFVAAVKDSYLPENRSDASVRDLGVGVKADFYVKVPDNKLVGNGQLSVGVFGQRDLAPKAVASYSTSVGKFQVFTDQVLSRGLDSWRLSGSDTTYTPGMGGPVPVADTEKPEDGIFYSATAGTMYVNGEWHFTLYAEYLYNGAGSTDSKLYRKWLERYGAEQNPASGLGKTLSLSDLSGYLGTHNSAVSLSWSELFNDEDFGFSVTWLQNWCDRSGMARPAITWKPVKHLILETGANLAWGDDYTEWALKNTQTGSLVPARTSGYIAFKVDKEKF